MVTKPKQNPAAGELHRGSLHRLLCADLVRVQLPACVTHKHTEITPSDSSSQVLHSLLGFY